MNRIHFFKAGNGLRNPAWMERIKTRSYQKWFIGIATALIVTVLVSPTLRLPLKQYEESELASKEIRSAQDLLVEDERRTQEMRVEAERSIFSVYDYDPGVLMDAEKRIRAAFETPAVAPRKAPKATGKEDLSNQDVDSILHLSLTPREWRLLQKKGVKASVGEAVLRLIGPILNRGVVNDIDLLDPDSNKGLIIRNIHTRDERRDLPPFAFLDFKQARGKLRAQADLLPPKLGKETVSIALKIAEHLLRPNLTFNKNETEDRKTRAMERVKPVYFQVKRGEVVVRPGERVSDEQVIKINALKKAQQRTHLISLLSGLLLLIFLILATLHQFSTKNIRKVLLSQKDLLFFSTTLVCLVAVLKLFQMVADVLSGEFFSIPSSSYFYLFPIAAGTMLVRIVINSEVAIFFAVLVSYFSAVMMGNQLFFFIFTLVGSLLGAHKVAQCEQRSILIKAGVAVGGMNLLLIFSSYLISGSLFQMTILSDMVMGFLAGPLASVLLLGIAPVVEILFGYTTDIKLLELANMDNPILKDLILQAPGTYHHSIIVGSLAEAGAKSIAANPLLARVSAYYHDIGKLKKPLYFIENTGGMANKHEHLVPTMSGLILLSHVKDGLEIAREHHLGQRIAHIIQQHHGTSLISYFYQKAKEKENSEMESIGEVDFRYPGPKPQTKEAGIVMLADAVEAASRALSDPTPSRMKSLLQRIMNNIFLDGQLDECELTLKDLQKIQESFIRILTAIFHQRIDYPAHPAGDALEQVPDEDQDSKSAKTYPLRSKGNKKGGTKDIDRVGTAGS